MSQESKIISELQIKFNDLAIKAVDELYVILRDASEPFKVTNHQGALILFKEGSDALESVTNLIERNYEIEINNMDARISANPIAAP